MSLTKVTYSMIQGAYVNVQDFGADASGTINSSAAIQAAIDSGATTIAFPQGDYLIDTPLTITQEGQRFIGLGGNLILKQNASMSDSVFTANNVNNLTFQDLKFSVSSSVTHTGVGLFMYLNTCDFVKITGCVFDAEIKSVSTNKESLFSLVSSPDCNNLLIENNQFRYGYGNACGANNISYPIRNGSNVSIIGNLFYNVMDTGVGCWTGASNVTITGNVFNRNDSSTSYNGVHIDVAGASEVTINGNSFYGNTMGIRMLSNLGYSNNNIVITGNTFADQFTGISEPATCIKVSHYSNDSVTNNEDVIIKNNTFKVVVWGVDIISTVTDTNKALKFQIDGNTFDISETNSIGVFFQKLNTSGCLLIVPGSNVFTGAGSNAKAVSGVTPDTKGMSSQQNMVSYRTDFQFTGTVAQTLESFYCDRGLYGIFNSLGTCIDGGGVGGVLKFATLGGVPVTSTSGFDQIISAASSNTISSQYWYPINTQGNYQIAFFPQVSGNTDNYYYLTSIRLL